MCMNAAILKSNDPAALSASLADERPEDIAEILNRKPLLVAAKVIDALPEPLAVETLDQPQLVRAAAILSRLAPEKAARLLDAMSADQAADSIRELRVSTRNDLVARVNPETKAALDRLLLYPETQAGAIMTTEFVAVPADWTVQQTLDHLKEVETTRETIYSVFVIDPATGRLLAAAPLRRLIGADPQISMKAAAPARPPLTVYPETPIEDAVRLISKYNLLAIPVVDSQQHVVGIVTVDDAVDTLVADQDEEMQKFGGVEPLDGPYWSVGFLGMIQKRAGWLCALFLAEMLTASAMQTYEAELEKAVVLALFIPLIMSSGGNSGGQATSLIIRALALEDVKLRDWWRVILRELPTGLTLGAILGAIGALRITLWQAFGFFDYGPHWPLVALTIALSLVGIVTFGSLMGSLLPFIAKRLGFDPATASAPFVATLVDVTGIVIYFTIARAILAGTIL